MNADTLAPPDMAARRATMVASQLRTVGVTDEAVLTAMGTIAREDFVPAALAGLAYGDAALEVAPGRWLLEPMALALLLQHAAVTPGMRALVVGAATGYSAAVLAAMGAKVTALDDDMAPRAVPGVTVAQGPLCAGWPAAAPYDLILFEGAIALVPAAIAAQLAPGGRAAAVVREAGVGRAMVGPVLADGRIAGLAFLEVAAHLLPGFAAPRGFVF